MTYLESLKKRERHKIRPQWVPELVLNMNSFFFNREIEFCVHSIQRCSNSQEKCRLLKTLSLLLYLLGEVPIMFIKLQLEAVVSRGQPVNTS